MDSCITPDVPFTAIIEADHDYILSLASRLGDPSTSDSQFFATFAELTWRLIRHDICEELVMRPAFIRFLGATGREMASTDRDDHVHIRQQLVSLWYLIHVQSRDNVKEIGRSRILSCIAPLLTEMAEHMKEESGYQIPRLRQHLNNTESLRLGNEYAVALTITPDVEKLESVDSTATVSSYSTRTIGAYIRTDMDDFRQMLAHLMDGGITEVTMHRMKEELRTLNLCGISYSPKERYDVAKMKL